MIKGLAMRVMLGVVALCVALVVGFVPLLTLGTAIYLASNAVLGTSKPDHSYDWWWDPKLAKKHWEERFKE